MGLFSGSYWGRWERDLNFDPPSGAAVRLLEAPIFFSGELMMAKHGMKPPKKGGKPKKITTPNDPGGPKTPGAKGTYPKPPPKLKR